MPDAPANRFYADCERIAQSYPDSLFDQVKCYAMFIGHARSGHSLVGAILDAHPNIVIANELHALPLFQRYDCDRLKVFKLILAWSQNATDQDRWARDFYNYRIDGLFQGRYQALEVIGDKKGGASTRYFLNHPRFARRFIQEMGALLRIILVIRNPYDTISAQDYRAHRPVSEETIDHYFRSLDGMIALRELLDPAQFTLLYHEDLIARRREEISRLCAFLGQEVPPDFLDRCSQAIHESPHQRRYKMNWTEPLKDSVRRRIESDPFRPWCGHYGF